MYTISLYYNTCKSNTEFLLLNFFHKLPLLIGGRKNINPPWYFSCHLFVFRHPIQLLSNIRFLITPRQTSWYPYSRTILRLKPKNWITLFQIDANKHCSCKKTWNVSVFTNSLYFEHKINIFSRYDNTCKSKRAFSNLFFHKLSSFIRVSQTSFPPSFADSYIFLAYVRRLSVSFYIFLYLFYSWSLYRINHATPVHGTDSIHIFLRYFFIGDHHRFCITVLFHSHKTSCHTKGYFHQN